MNIFAKVIADSVTAYGTRLTTMEIALPKVILSEFNTHRVFSRNFSSSRAIPNAKLITQDSFEPTFYGKNVAGMKALNEEIEKKEEAKVIWENAIQYCKNASNQLAELGLHKQWANRLNDWHTMARGIVSSTDWDNFFALRDHPDAQPEIRTLAIAMKTALANSTPVKLTANEWHLPYVTEQERILYRDDTLCRMSAARCCRVSYLKHDGDKPAVEEDLKLCERLAGSVPKHYSPFEHIAHPDEKLEDCSWANPNLHGNFTGWCQYRKIDEAVSFSSGDPT